jgi:integrase/recombinase XerD
MAPKRGKKSGRGRTTIGNPNDPEGVGVWVTRYLESLRVRNFSERTAANAQSSLGLFVEWSEARSVVRPDQVTRPILEGYQRHLFYARKRDGKPLSFATQRVRMTPLRSFFKWLVRQNVLPSNPASDLDLPRPGKRLPAHVLTVDEVERVMEQPDLSTPLGLRDRAILEVLYSSGIRRLEVIGLSIYDLDFERRTVRVRQGKGQRDRIVPIGERALAWVRRYLDSVRPELVMPPDESILFLTSTGEPLSPSRLTEKVRSYVLAAELGKTGSCHLFRHTMATLMLEGGADVRYIQEMLGHTHLSSTEIYTRVSIQKLRAIHEATHPGAKLEGAEREHGHADISGNAEELLAALHDEAHAEDDTDGGGDGRK